MFIAAAGNAANIRNIQIKLFDNEVLNEDMSNYAYIKKDIPNIPLSYFTNLDISTVFVQNTSAVANDGLVLSTITIKYPSKFNFNGKLF